MYQSISIQQTGLALFCAPPGLPLLDPAVVERQRADDHWLLLHAGQIVARCSLWWQHAPPYPGHRLGLIGHYAAGEAAAGVYLLTLACRQLAQQGCTLAAGPMDGNTWQRYRLLVERGSEPVFFLEPDNPDDWPDHFVAAGFSRLAGYTSALADDLARPDPSLERAARRVAERGVVFRPLDLSLFEPELARIYTLALASFRPNLMFTPVGPADFEAQYRPLLPYLRPELVWLAERQGHLLGFIFAVPDLLQARHAQAIDTVIIKTVAVDPAYSAAGLGHLLVGRCQAAACELGYRRAIHALMHEDNDSQRISARFGGRTVRRYVLFGRELQAG